MSTAWFKFYPADWRADPALRMCSIAARGLWLEMLCVMHEAEPRGHMLIKGSSVNARQIASLVGISLKEVTAGLAELEAAGVFSREGEVIFSRRMCRDTEKAERDKANGKGGGNPHIKAGVNPPDNRRDKAQNPEARIQKPKEDRSSSLVGKVAREPFEAELRATLGERSPPENVDFGPILALIEAGYDPVKDILAACRAASGKTAESVGSWQYYATAVSRKPKTNGTPGSSAVWLPSESPLWAEISERNQREKGRPLRAMGSAHEAGVGAFVPAAWLEERVAA